MSSTRKSSPSASRSNFSMPLNPNSSAVDLNSIYSPSAEDVTAIIDALTNQSISERNAHIKKRMEENSAKVLEVTDNFYKLSMERRNAEISCNEGSRDLLAKRQNDDAVLVELNIHPRHTAPQIALPKVEKLPRYTTWIFLDRNQRLTEDQSTVGQRMIFYDENGEEVIITSDSEEEEEEEEEYEIRDFSESEDCVLRRTIDEMGPDDLTMGLLSQHLSRTPAEVKERYEYLVKNDNIGGDVHTEGTEGRADHCTDYIDKDLPTAMDSFDVLFCRRCLVFDCKLHGCSQDLIFPAEKQSKGSCPDEEMEPCGPACFRLALESNENRNGKELAESVEAAKNKQKVADFECFGAADGGGASNETQWKPFEKSMYEKGIEIFGKNSCLIARNLLSGLKSCSEIFRRMQQQSKETSQEGNRMPLSVGSSKGAGGSGRRRFSRYKSFRKKISKRRDHVDNPQYNPCGCETACRETCPCFENGTCCEKYCGCPKSCKNRYRGCFCAKNQCQSRQCPCFAANRECDPDVCRNCCLSCGDGTLGVSSQGGSKNECKNMKLLLRQHQKVLLGRSDVNGWGAFLKNGVGKDVYIGEYTGEVISHGEAEKRGKIYDRINSSFLFNLNSEVVLDAQRMGNKLKFANHSPHPNCYPKVVLVRGEHRVGIFSSRPLRAGEEIFYDYRYEEGTMPPWMEKLEASGSSSKREIIGKKEAASAPSHRCTKKHI